MFLVDDAAFFFPISFHGFEKSLSRIFKTNFVARARGFKEKLFGKLITERSLLTTGLNEFFTNVSPQAAVAEFPNLFHF